MTASTLIMIPAVLLHDGISDLGNINANVWSAIISLGILCTAFAYIVYFSIVRAAGATNASLVTLLVPVSAILLGTIFLGEHLAVRDVAGMGLIGLGLLTIDGRTLAAVQNWQKA
jgi:drug/metabolite transporter (DMT)-like permease